MMKTLLKKSVPAIIAIAYIAAALFVGTLLAGCGKHTYKNTGRTMYQSKPTASQKRMAAPKYYRHPSRYRAWEMN